MISGPGMQIRPPSDLAVDPHWQLWVTVANFLVLCCVVVVVIRSSEKRKIATNLAIIAGGGLSFFLEPLADHIGLIWQYRIGQWIALDSFGNADPLWLLFSYFWYIGGQTVYLVYRLRRGAAYLDIWKLYGFFALADFALELPALWSGKIYVYFGDQPFWWPPFMPLPLWYVFANALLPISGGLAVAAAEHLVRNWRSLTIVALVPMFSFGMFFGTTFPVTYALNSDVSSLTRWIAGGLSIGLGLLFVNIAARLLSVAFSRQSEQV